MRNIFVCNSNPVIEFMLQLKSGGVIIDYRTVHYINIYNYIRVLYMLYNIGTSSKLFVMGNILLSAISLYNRLSGVRIIVVTAMVHISRSVCVQIKSLLWYL
jgi:hypothetical protein